MHDGTSLRSKTSIPKNKKKIYNIMKFKTSLMFRIQKRKCNGIIKVTKRQSRYVDFIEVFFTVKS